MHPAWNEYRRRRRARRLAIFLLPLWLVPGAVMNYLLVSWGLADRDLRSLAVTSPPVLIFLVANRRLRTFACPRCGQPFQGSWLNANAFARRCLYCGLPLWADPSGANAPEAERPSH